MHQRLKLFDISPGPPKIQRLRFTKTGGRPQTTIPHAKGDIHASTDVIALGNICLDVFVEVEELPPRDPKVRRQLLDDLMIDPPGEASWEVGGNCNFMIAAARIGMSVGSLGHVGADRYGEYVDRILQVTNG
jgi:hypothetical protein